MAPNADTSLAYYLGSKRRVASAIVAEAERLAPDGGAAIDLFSGMGAASAALSRFFNITAVDAQEYSRAVCSALLGDAGSNWDARFFSEASRRREALRRVYSPLLEYEQGAMGEGTRADKIMAELIEHGCLLPQYDAPRPDGFRSAVAASLQNRSSASAEEVSYDVAVRYYGGTYFSYEQAIDIASLRGAAGSAPEALRDRYLACSVCTTSQCGSTVGGQFAQPLKPRGTAGEVKASAVRKARAQRSRSIFETAKRVLDELDVLGEGKLPGEAVRGECTSFLRGTKKEVSLVYADPPYSRYHYSRYYHVLETIALADEPPLSANPATGQPARGIYRNDRYQSPYSTRTRALPAFEGLFEAVAEVSPNFVLSYSPYPHVGRATPRMATIGALCDIAHRFFAKVEVRPVDGVRHSKLTREDSLLESSAVSEVLITCRN